MRLVTPAGVIRRHADASRYDGLWRHYTFAMTTEPLLIELTTPIPSAVRLPGNGGSVEGEVTAVEVQPDCGELWIRVKIPVWQRWRTQLAVGRKAVQGIGPAWTEMWAPAAAVEIDVDEMPGLSKLVQAHKASSG